MRRTKILATIGPASMKPGVLEEMIAAGLDAVRLNFSHGTHEAHAAAYLRVREASARAGRYVAVLQDLQGPKIRIGRVKGDGMDVPTGSTLVVTTREVEAVGKHPVESVRRMGSIAETTEERLYPFDRPLRPAGSGWPPPGDLGAVAARLAGHAAREASPAAIAVYSRDGRTAQLVSDERPRAPVLALSPDESVCRRLALYWGVVPHRVDDDAAGAESLAVAERTLVERGLAREGDPVVCVAGDGGAGSIRLTRLGHATGAGRATDQ